MKSKGNYDPGTYLDNPETINADRISTKIDWNISEKQKLSVSYRYTKADRYNTNTSSNVAVQFGNNGWIQPNKTHSLSAELKRISGKNASNKFLFTYSNVADDRSPIGDPYPRIVIYDGLATSGSKGLIIGSDKRSNVNILTQQNWSIIDVVKLNVGKHALSFGGEWDDYTK